MHTPDVRRFCLEGEPLKIEEVRTNVDRIRRLAELYGNREMRPTTVTYEHIEHALEELLSQIPQPLIGVRYILTALAPKVITQAPHYLPFLYFPILGAVLCGEGDGKTLYDVPLDLLDGILDEVDMPVLAVYEGGKAGTG